MIKSLGVLLLMLMLQGCQRKDDLETFIAEVNKRPPGPIEPFPSVKMYEHYVYSSSGLRSPFEPPTIDKIRAGKGNGPDMNRPKEPLEAFPLDSLKFVGAIQRRGALWALITDKSGMVYHLRVGNYLGQNYGRINKILENKLELTEMVVDNQGRWEQRPTTLNLLP